MFFRGPLAAAGSTFPAKPGKVVGEAGRMGCGKQDCVGEGFAVTFVQFDFS